MPSADYWRKFPLLRDVDIEFIEHLLSQCLERELAAGESILVGADKPVTIYLVLEGELAADNGKRFGFGSALGDENLLLTDKQSLQLKAVDKVRLLVMPEDDFWRMSSLDPQLARNLAQGKIKKPMAFQLKRMALWVGAGALLILAGLGIATYGHFNITDSVSDRREVADVAEQDLTQRPMHTVSAKPVTDWLQVNGSVQPRHWTDVNAPFDSAVRAMQFRFGDAVKQGQLLAELDASDLQVKLRQAQTQTINARLEVDKLKGWKNSADVAKAKRDLSSAQESLRSAKHDYENTKRLFDKGIVSKQELDTAKSSIKDKSNSVLASKESLAGILKQGDSTKLQVAEMALANAEFAQVQLELQVKGANVISPTTGIIFPSQQTNTKSKTKAEDQTFNLGASVSRNTLMFTIADMVGIAVEANVPEKDVLKLKRGQAAKVSIEALPGVVLEGAIDQIAGRGTEDRRKGASFLVRVVVDQLSDQQREQVRIGMSARSRIKIYDNPAAIVVPFGALQIDGRKASVMLRATDGSFEKKRVKIHNTLVDGVEVSSGLAVGDQILLFEDE